MSISSQDGDLAEHLRESAAANVRRVRERRRLMFACLALWAVVFGVLVVRTTHGFSYHDEDGNPHGYACGEPELFSYTAWTYAPEGSDSTHGWSVHIFWTPLLVMLALTAFPSAFLACIWIERRRSWLLPKCAPGCEPWVDGVAAGWDQGALGIQDVAGVSLGDQREPSGRRP